MQQISDWLKELGMAKYVQRFLENDIDVSALRYLTDQDLEKIGVSLGHRRKMLAAITELVGAMPAAPKSALTEPKPKDAAERRQITVMFVDLVGSTALSARLDPEDMREIIGAYHRCCAEQIAKAGGFVAKYMGDGVLAYFGYPQAHEDEAERPVRAALSLTQAIPQLHTEHGAALQVRIGIATGLVVVGDLIGEGDAQERGVVGDTPNLAARLQSLAEPGQVVISHSSRRLTGGVFEYRDLGKVTLKGLADPVQAWQVLGVSALESRFEAQHGGRLTPLVGREEELELMLRRWQQAGSGEGRVVLLSGEAGMGKSRLTVELQERLQHEPHTRLRYFCSPHHADSALYPTIAQLERAARFERDDSPEIQLDKMMSLLGPSSVHQNDIQLLSELLSIPTGDHYTPLNWSPQRKKEKTFEALLWQLEMLSRQRPVLVIYEDVHWLDPSSRELLDMTVERVASLPVLLVVTFRPEFQRPWTDQAHVSTLTLSRLGRREGMALVERVAGNNALPNGIMAEIVERADGIPLFVEELTKAVLEGGSHDDDPARSVSITQLSALAVPATLHASLMARLDRLGPVAKQVAQTSAAIGREFSFELLAPIAQKSDADLQAALRRLGEAGLVLCRGAPPVATFLFKHVLVRDVAYGSLLRGMRKQLHARIAEVYATRFPETARAQPELIAHHFTEAGLIDPAVDYWRRAGELAMARSAHTEAVRHFSTALDLVAKTTDTPNRAVRELELCINIGPALMMSKGTARPEVEAIYIRAVTLGAGEDSPQRFKSLWGLYYYLMTSGRLQEAARRADELLALAQRLVADDLVLEAHHAKWTTSLWLGDLAAANANCQLGKSQYDGHRHHGLAFTFSGHDPGVCAHSIGAISSILSGFPQRAMELVQQAVALARGLSHPYSLALAMWHWAIVLQIGRQGRSCRDLATELITLSQAHDFPMMLGYGTFFLGWATADAGEIKAGIALMEQGLSLVASTGRGVTRPYMQTILACAKADLGNLPEAIALVDEALRAMEVTGERWWEAELRHVSGRLALARGERDESERCFQQSLVISRGQGAKSLELRASTSLARLWRDQGKRGEARDLLAPIYNWFTEGFDTPVLQDAKLLLDQLP
jgi:class 3 adenylate cyclase/predicted ATPase